MKRLKSCIFGLSVIILTGCQTTSHLRPAIEDAQARVLSQPFSYIKQQQKRPVIALVLGSGGARGYAHIGVIQVLEQQGIRPDFIVGTSAGSIVGSIYASGKTAAELRDIALKLKANDVRDVNVSLKGFFNGKKVEDYINQQVRNTPCNNSRFQCMWWQLNLRMAAEQSLTMAILDRRFVPRPQSPACLYPPKFMMLNM